MGGWLPPGCTDKDVDEACPGYWDEPAEEGPMLSYKVEISVGKGWHDNKLRFLTWEEADAWGCIVISRWSVPCRHRVVETQDAPCYPPVEDHGEDDA